MLGLCESLLNCEHAEGECGEPESHRVPLEFRNFGGRARPGAVLGDEVRSSGNRFEPWCRSPLPLVQ
jgi:hypothetical protein